MLLEVPRADNEARVNGRKSKFTQTNINQIMNLHERGKTPEEIAEIIGVTVGTLKVTCSKLGISLRRRRSRTLPNQRLYQNGRAHDAPAGQNRVDKAAIDDPQYQQKAVLDTAVPHQIVVRSSPTLNQEPIRGPDLCGVTLTLRYRGEERLINITLDRNLLGLLALEAEFRSMSIGNLIAEMLRSIAHKDMFAEIFRP